MDVQYNGFRQVWWVNPSHVFDGPYTVYWDAGPALCMHGHYLDGAQHGLWTYWSRDGSVERQIIFERDEEREVHEAPPWKPDDSVSTSPPL